MVPVADSIPKSSGGSSDKDGASKLQSDGNAKSKQSVMEKQVSEKTVYSDADV